MSRTMCCRSGILVVLVLLGMGMLGCQMGENGGRQGGGAQLNTLTPEQESAGWELLFDGETLNGWRGYQLDTIPEGWHVHQQSIYHDGSNDDDDYVPIVTTQQYADFELRLEWKVVHGTDSGVFFRVTEDHPQEFHTGPEFQLSDHTQADLDSLRLPGANYELHAPTRVAARPEGEWNDLRLVVNGTHVEHWLNGSQVLSYEIGSADWKQRVRESGASGWPDFTNWPDYGMNERGYIGLQDHGGPVWFRNIRIRPLS